VLIGKVVGTVVSTQKTESLEGLKLYVVKNMGADGKDARGYVVAADSVGSGVGEIVLYATGSSARQTDVTDNRPVDAIITGVIDTWDLEGDTVYTKYESAETTDE